MLWLDSIPPNVPQNVVARLVANNGNVMVSLSWQTPLPAADKEPVYGYVIYRFEGSEKIDINKPDNILHIAYDNGLSYQDKTVQKGKTYLYIITALDRLKNESDRSPTIAVVMP